MGCDSNRSDLPVFLVFSKFFKFMQLDLERQTHSLSLTFDWVIFMGFCV